MDNVGSTRCISSSPVLCTICLGAENWPKARPKKCEHTFCYLCIKEWVKRRSECPLCKQPARALLVVEEDGTQREVTVPRRTAAQYENEISRDEEPDAFQEAEDITVAYARCHVCNLSNNEHLLMLCDGIVGRNDDGNPIYCNAACHCYCLPEKLDSVPDGDWLCAFCADLRATQESVYNTRYIQQRNHVSSTQRRHVVPAESEFTNDEPGSSGINQGIRRSRYRSGAGSVYGSASTDVESEPSSRSRRCSSSSCSSGGTSDEELEIDENLHSDTAASFEGVEDGDDWSSLDNRVLSMDSDKGYDPKGLTEVKRSRKRVRRKKRKQKTTKRKMGGKKKTKRRSRSADTTGKTIWRKRRKKRPRKGKGVTAAQKRLAEAIGLDPLTGRQKKKERCERHFPSDGIRRGPFGAPVLSLRRGDNFDIPVEEPSPQRVENIKEDVQRKKPMEETDLITTIMFEQTKTLAPARYQRIVRDGTIVETEEMVEHRKRVEDKIAACKALASSEHSKGSNENTAMFSTSSSEVDVKGKRKKRPSRWGTPTTSRSHESAVITASIPLPIGPPVAQPAVSLENIPIPSTNQQTSLSHLTLLSRPSALNTAPSTSFSVNASPIPSFGMPNGQPQINLGPFAGPALGQQPLGLGQQSLVTLGQQQLTGLGQQTLAGLGQQSVAGLNQPQLTSIGQGSMVHMQPPLLPNLFLPPLNLGAMNSLLAAGLLANSSPLAAPPITQSLAQPSSVAATPFMLNPVQLSASGQQLNLVNLATTLQQQQQQHRNVDTLPVVPPPCLPHHPPKPPEGVPPPPPVNKPPETTANNISLCEPLAEKIRKLIEASNVRPLCDSIVEDGATKTAAAEQPKTNNEPLCDDSKTGERGRKSASADDEETGEAVKAKKCHKNGAMFEAARQMLSFSLKKVYRLKQINKQEYKEIMKKGVRALSQRTKLDQRKVDDYAAKYVECIVHRRKKRH